MSSGLKIFNYTYVLPIAAILFIHIVTVCISLWPGLNLGTWQ
jgi:hypothetical protein